MKDEIQVRPHDNGWDVIRHGGRYAESHHETEREAIAVATALAKRESAVLAVYRRDGEIKFTTGHRNAGVPDVM